MRLKCPHRAWTPYPSLHASPPAPSLARTDLPSAAEEPSIILKHRHARVRNIPGFGGPTWRSIIGAEPVGGAAGFLVDNTTSLLLFLSGPLAGNGAGRWEELSRGTDIAGWCLVRFACMRRQRRWQRGFCQGADMILCLRLPKGTFTSPVSQSGIPPLFTTRPRQHIPPFPAAATCGAPTMPNPGRESKRLV